MPASLEATLREVRKELEKKDSVREKASESLRRVTSLSKQAILMSHQKKVKKALNLIENVEEILSKIAVLSSEHPDVIYSGLYHAALQEYSEAKIFLSLIEESTFVTPEEIKVPSLDYVLGLADVVGECRRLVLDALREGNTKKGEKYLQIMDEIYFELTTLNEDYLRVPGLRRKCDVARKITEITRGDVTQEVRRKALEDYLKRFDKSQNKSKGSRKG